MKTSRLVFAIAAALASVSPAHAQEPSYPFIFTVSEINVIEGGLNEIARKFSQPIIEKMHGQLQTELVKRAAEAKAKEPVLDANGTPVVPLPKERPKP